MLERKTTIATSDTGPITCKVDDVEWVRYFTRHGVPRPAMVCLISPRPPQPQGRSRHAQWRGRQGPHGASQGSSRTFGGRPQPHSQGAAPHKSLPRSSAFNGFPAERSTNNYIQCHHTNTKTYDVRKGQLSLRDCGSTLQRIFCASRAPISTSIFFCMDSEYQKNTRLPLRFRTNRSILRG